MAKGPHHRGSFQVRSEKVRAAANRDPSTRCWRCGRTLWEVRMEKPDAVWQAGHLVDGEVGGALAPECSPCNHRAGGALRAAQMRPARTPLSW